MSAAAEVARFAASIADRCLMFAPDDGQSFVERLEAGAEALPSEDLELIARWAASVGHRAGRLAPVRHVDDRGLVPWDESDEDADCDLCGLAAAQDVTTAEAAVALAELVEVVAQTLRCRAAVLGVPLEAGWQRELVMTQGSGVLGPLFDAARWMHTAAELFDVGLIERDKSDECRCSNHSGRGA